jgi:hypothetical protein
VRVIIEVIEAEVEVLELELDVDDDMVSETDWVEGVSNESRRAGVALVVVRAAGGAAAVCGGYGHQ